MLLVKKIRRKIYKLFYPAWGEVLMLHRVVNHRSTLFDNRLMEVSPSFLEKTILDYKKKRYQFVSIDEVYSILASKSQPKQKFVCFTFDDGYIDNFTFAYPIFKKYNVPFAIYVATDFPNYKALLWWYVLEDILLNNNTVELGDGSFYKCKSVEDKNTVFRLIREKIFQIQDKEMQSVLNNLFQKYNYSFKQKVQENALTWGHIKQLAQDPLCTIASHTLSHPPLDNIGEGQLINELALSKQELGQQTQTNVEHFAYPYGRYNEMAIQQVHNMGYKTAVLADGGKVRRDFNIYSIKRFSLIE